MQDALGYDEPPSWYYPVRETLGAELLANKKAAMAEAFYRDDLKRNPDNPRSLYGLAESLRIEGKAGGGGEGGGAFHQGMVACGRNADAGEGRRAVGE